MFRGEVSTICPASGVVGVRTTVKPLFFVACKFFRVPDFTPRGQKLKTLPPLGHVHQLFQRYKEFLGIRRWRSGDLDTLPMRDSAMNSQTVASSVIPHVSKSASNLHVSRVRGARKCSLSRVRFTRPPRMILQRYSLGFG